MCRSYHAGSCCSMAGEVYAKDVLLSLGEGATDAEVIATFSILAADNSSICTDISGGTAVPTAVLEAIVDNADV